jgi:hypothetical protein
MKKFWTITGLLAVFVAVVALVGVTAVSAQGPVNPDAVPGTGQRHGQTGNHGGGLGIMAVDEAEMHAALAAALGMSVTDFEAAIANGETLATLALAQGVDLADLQAVMASVHANAAQDAVANGLVTQEQVDWMQSHRGGQGGQGRMGGQGAAGTGNMTRGGQHGAGGNGGDCIYNTAP